MGHDTWAIGVDLGGTKVRVAAVDAAGAITLPIKEPTDVKGGPEGVIAQIARMVRQVREPGSPSPPLGAGVGVAGQVTGDSGVVRFAPNLDWREVPFRDLLSRALELPVVIANDVRAATWGEWLHGAGQGVDDLVCVFIGTGIGGGVVSGGRVLSGCSNTAGELGHMTIDLNGPRCTCGNRGCLEALAGGWAIARQARQAVNDDPAAGVGMLKAAGLSGQVSPEDITAKVVTDAFRAGDPLARHLVDEVARALVAGMVALVNAFNPCRLILGGGVMAGLPELIGPIDDGIRRSALKAATETLQVLPARLRHDAGVVGAAALAHRTFAP